MVGVDLLDLVVAEKEGDEFSPVGGDADILFTGLPLAVRQVARQPLFCISSLLTQIGLELEHCAAQQGVDPAPDFGHRLLELDVLAVGAEAIDQKPMHQHTDLLVTGPRGEFRDQLSNSSAFSTPVSPESDHTRHYAGLTGA